MRALALFLIIVLAKDAAAQVYKCEVDGQISYQARPCEPGQAQTEVNVSTAKSTPKSDYAPLEEGGTRKLCEKRWPDDYRMQLHCIEQQNEYAGLLLPMVEQAQSDPALRRIMVMCVERWRDKDLSTSDFRMAHDCVEKQLEAKNQIR